MKKAFMLLLLVLSLFIYVPAKAKTVTTNSLANSQVSRSDAYADAGILGDPSDENSVAWLLNKIFDYVKIIGPILVVVLSSIDFLKVILNGDDDAMKKAQKKLGVRLILAALLFFIPLLVQAMLSWFGITGSTAGIQ